MQEGVNDNGWGCAYRSMQTLCSWLNLVKFSTVPVPSHSEIQKMLIKLGDKTPDFLNSKQWIGAFEINLCLSAFFGVRSRLFVFFRSLSLLTNLSLTRLHAAF